MSHRDRWGKWVTRWAPHPPLVGRDAQGNFLTKAAAAYPAELGKTIAAAIVAGGQWLPAPRRP
eukprot:6811659-Alexandrium_andersonii.AAC.1